MFYEHKLKIIGKHFEYVNKQFERLVFCNGLAAHHSKFFNWLPFNPVKGEMMNIRLNITLATLLLALPQLGLADTDKGEIQHDAEYAILEVQNREAWAADDQAIDKILTEIRKKNGGQPPNIVYILLDDVGFGEVGMDELSVIRGYKTPSQNRCSSTSYERWSPSRAASR